MTKIPEYLKKGEDGRYHCVCGETISELFADLGCDCNGEGRSENFADIKSDLDVLGCQIANLPQKEQDYLREFFNDLF